MVIHDDWMTWGYPRNEGWLVLQAARWTRRQALGIPRRRIVFIPWRAYITLGCQNVTCQVPWFWICADYCHTMFIRLEFSLILTSLTYNWVRHGSPQHISYMEVSWSRGTPWSSILIRISIIHVPLYIILFGVALFMVHFIFSILMMIIQMILMMIIHFKL